MIPADMLATRRLTEPQAVSSIPMACEKPSPPTLPWEPHAWRRELAAAVTDLDELLALAGVDGSAVSACRDTDFAIRVPRPYVARMRWGDPQDPLLRQVLPVASENAITPGYGEDPLAEAAAMVESGLMHKYAGRVLVLVSGACAVNCRYCFRRHFPYGDHRQDSGFPAIDAIRKDASIREVILSGGDPLLLTDEHFAGLVARVAGIDQVARIRIHTRLPVVIPQRVTAALIETLAEVRQRVVVVLHVNHPREIDADCRLALRALGRFTLLNQSVLLRGVNDDAGVLVQLSEDLFEAGVLPYYLHMPDAVAGTAHFDVAEDRALAIHRRMAASLPGYLVPRLVRETPGAAAKELVVSP